MMLASRAGFGLALGSEPGLRQARAMRFPSTILLTILLSGVAWAASAPWSTDFESGLPSGWTAEGQASGNAGWQVGMPVGTAAPTPPSGSSAAGVGLDATGDYASHAAVSLITDSLSFPASGTFVLTFEHWINSQAGADGGVVEYSIDDGGSWAQLGLLAHYDDPDVDALADEQDGYDAANGVDGGALTPTDWRSATFVLPSSVHGSSQVRLRWRFASDGSDGNEDPSLDGGWFIDDVAISLATFGGLDHFTVTLSTPQFNGVAFTGANTVVAEDAANNPILTFDASATNVTLSPAPADGDLTGLGSSGENVLDQAADFVNGVADLTALGMAFDGLPGAHAISASGGGASGTSNEVFISTGATRDVYATPGSLDFGYVYLGQRSGAMSFELLNVGGATLSVTTVVSNDADYAIDPALGSFALAAFGGSQTVTVYFTPSKLGVDPGNLLVYSDDPDENPLTVPLTGVGGLPDIAVSHGSVDFGDMLVGDTEDRTLRIQNTGTAPLTVTDISPDEIVFSVSGVTLPAEIPVGGYIDVGLHFTPSAAGKHTATLEILSDDPDEATVNVALRGFGVLDLDLSTATADLEILGADAGDSLGGAITSGDLNGDGVDDLIVSAPSANTGSGVAAGEVYVLYGDESLSGTFDLSSQSADVTIGGDDTGDACGAALAVGDVNGDGTGDLIIGAPLADPPAGGMAGEVYVIFGGAGLPPVIDLHAGSADVTIYGKRAVDKLGTSVAAGDLDGDGVEDLVLGADYASQPLLAYTGGVYLIYGAADIPALIDLRTASADVTVFGVEAEDRLGSSVATGDMNGDSYDDLIAGAPGAGDGGATYVIFGSPALTGVLLLETTPADVTILGGEAGDHLGESVASGDVNGDGYDDLAAGAPGDDPAGGENAGGAILVYGSGSLPAEIDLASTTPDFWVAGDDPADQLGRIVALGDVNGDGYDDLVVGALGAGEAGRPETGATYVVHGARTLSGGRDLNSHYPDANLIGRAPGDRLGGAVATGDVTGDGVPDLMTGAADADPVSRADAGTVYRVSGTLYGREAESETIAGIESGDAAPRTFVGDFVLDFASGPGGTVTVGATDTLPPQKRASFSPASRYWSVASSISAFTANISVTYDPGNIGGLPEDTLSLYHLARGSDEWAALASSVNTVAKTVSTQNPVEAFSLFCLGASPDIGASPTALDFGDVIKGDSAEQSFTISNSGSAALAIASIEVLDPVNFSVISPSIFPLYLSPGNTLTVDMRFAPSVEATIPSQVIITSNDPDEPQVAIGVEGRGIIGPPDHFDLSLASPQTDGVPFRGTNTITVRDPFDNIVRDFDASVTPVTLVTDPDAGVTLRGLGSGDNHVLNQATNFVNGIADLASQGLTFEGPTGTYTFTASMAGGVEGVSSPVEILLGELENFLVELSGPQVNGQMFIGTNTITARDVGGNVITNFNAADTNVTLTASSGGAVSGLGSLGGNVLDQAADFVDGVVDLTGQGMVYTGSAGLIAFTATGGGASGTSGQVEIQAGPFAALTIELTSPQAVAAPLTGTSRIVARDVSGNPVTDFDASQTPMALSAAPPDGVIGGLGATPSVLDEPSDFVDGVADLSGKLTLTGPTGVYSFAVTSGAASVVSGPITFGLGPIDHFVFDLTSPQMNDQVFSGTNTVTAYDGGGNLITNFDASDTAVTVKPVPDNGVVTGLGSVGDNVLDRATDFVGGTANLPMKFTGLVGTHQFIAEAGGSDRGTSAGVDIQPGALAQFRVVVSSPVTNGVPVGPGSRIYAEDVSGNTATNFDPGASPVTVEVVTGDGAVSGLGTEDDNLLDEAGDFFNGVADLAAHGMVFVGTIGARRFRASSGLIEGTSDEVDVVVGAHHHFAWSLTTPQRIGAAFTGVNQLRAEDVGNNLILDFDAGTDNVTVSTDSPDTGVSGLGSGNDDTLDRTSDFVNGVADLTAQGMRLTGEAGFFILNASTGSIEGVSGTIFASSGQPQDIAADPEAVDFGDVFVEEDATETFDLINVGETQLTVSTITTTDLRFTILSPPGDQAFVIPGNGGSQTVVVQFRPTAIGLREANVRVTSSDPDEPVFYVPVRGNGGPRDIDVYPTSLDFGKVGEGDSSDRIFLIRNTGTAPLTVSGILIDGSDFSLLSPAFPQTLTQNESVDVTARFSPSTHGLRTDILTVVSDDPDEGNVPVDLVGRGVRQVDLSSADADVDAQGAAAYDGAGAAVAAGDVNGDGFEDLLIGAPRSDPAGRTNAGSAYLILGRADLPAAVGLGSGLVDVTIQGAASNDRLGSAVAIGDLNADGRGDLLIGAPLASPQDRGLAGQVHVIYGAESLPASIDLAFTPSDVTVLGEESLGTLGARLASGDLNGDGYDDLAMSAPLANPSDREQAGRVYALAGSAALVAVWDLGSEPADLTVSGANAGDQLGQALAVGDLDHDHLADLVVGAPYVDLTGAADAGKAYVLRGQPVLPAATDLRYAGVGMIILGDDANDNLGAALACGDIDGDGYDDVVVGVPGADHSGGRDDAGQASVVLGSSSLRSVIDLGWSAADYSIWGKDAGDRWGSTAACADVNGDGFDDVVVAGAEAGPPSRPTAGETAVVHGHHPLSGGLDLSSVNPDFAGTGREADDRLGASLAAGDLDGDGVKDLVAGATGADAPGQTDAGAVYVFRGLLGGGDAIVETAAGIPAGDADPQTFVDAFTIDFDSGPGGDVSVAATDSLPPRKGAPWQFATRYWSASTRITSFSANLTVEYDPADLNGIAEDSLCLYRLRSGADYWQAVTCDVDPALNLVTTTVPITEFSNFALGASAEISVSPEQLDFGDMILGGSSDLPLAIANGGDADLRIESITSLHDDFSAVSPSFPQIVAAGEELTVSVRFAPTSLGLQETALMIVSGDPDEPIVSVPAQGTAVIGDLDHFSLSLAESQVNGVPFEGENLLVARDVHDNVITDFNASVTNVSFTVVPDGRVTGLGSTGTNILDRAGDFVDGVADLTALGITFIGGLGAHTFVATAGTAQGVSGSVEITIGPVDRFELSIPPVQTVGVPFSAPSVCRALDAGGNLITDFDASITNVTIRAEPSGGQVTGLGSAGEDVLDQELDFVDGVAQLDVLGLTFIGSAGTYTFLASAGDAAGISSPVTIGVGALDHFDFELTTPQRSGVSFDGGPNTITAKDISENTIRSFDASVTNVAITVSPSDGNLSISVLDRAQDFVDGVADLTGRLTFTGVTGSHVFIAKAGDAKGRSRRVSILAGPLVSLEISLTTPQTNGVGFAGANTVTARDGSGNPITDFDASLNPVTLSVTPDDGVISGLGPGLEHVLDQTDDFVGGVADVSGLVFIGKKGDHVFTASAGLVEGQSETVRITIGPLHHFDVQLYPRNTNGVPFIGTNMATALDVGENVIKGLNASDHPVSVTADPLGQGAITGLGAAGANVLDQRTDFVHGVADLSALGMTFTGAADTYYFHFTSGSATGRGGPVEIVPGALDHFDFVLRTPQSVGQPFQAHPNSITAKDVSGNPLTDFSAGSHPVTVTTDPPGGAVLGLGSAGGNRLDRASDFLGGVADLSFLGMRFVGDVGTYRFYASSNSAQGQSGAIEMRFGGLDHFVWNLAAEQTNGIPFTGVNTLTAQDAAGNLVTDFDAAATNVTITPAPDDGDITGLGAALTNVLDQTTDFVGGVANLTALGLRFTGTSGPHVLTASTSGVEAASDTVLISPAALNRFAWQLSSPQQSGVAFTGANTLTALDASGNAISAFDASVTPVTIIPVPADGAVTDLGSGGTNVLDRADDFVNGVADLSAMTFTGATGPHTFAASASGPVATESGPVRIESGPAQQFVLSLAGIQRNGMPFSGTNTLTIYDGAGAVIEDFDASETPVTMSASPADGVISGLGPDAGHILGQATDFVSGVADLTALGMTFTGAAGLHLFTASGAGALGSDQVLIEHGLVARFAVSLSSPQQNGVPFVGVNTVTALDESDNIVQDFSAASSHVTIAPSTGEVRGLGSGGGGVLDQADDFAGGIANLKGEMFYVGPEGEVVFTASTGDDIAGSSAPVTITIGRLDHFDVTIASPQDVGVPFVGRCRVKAVDVDGNTITDFDASINPVTVTSNPSVGVTIVGLGTQGANVLDRRDDFVNGVATLNELVFLGPPDRYRIVAQCGLAKGRSDRVKINVGPLAKFGVQLVSPYTDGLGFTGENRITAQDAAGNTVAAFNAAGNPVTITVEPDNGDVSGLGHDGRNVLDQATDFVGGVADLTALGMVYVGRIGPHLFTATDTESHTGSSDEVLVQIGDLHHFQLTLQSPQVNGQPFSGTNQLRAQDIGNNEIEDFDASVNNVALIAAPADGAITGLGSAGGNVLDRASDFVDGVADLGTLVFTGTVGPHVFAAHGGGVSGFSEEVDIVVGALSQFELALSSPQTNGLAVQGTNTLTAQDAGGNAIPAFSAAETSVAIAVESGQGVITGLGSTQQNVLDRAADFQDGVADLTALGMTYTGQAGLQALIASGGGATGRGEMNVQAGAATHFVFELRSFQRNDKPFKGTNRLTAADLSGNPAPTFSARTTPVTITVEPADGQVLGLGSGGGNVLDRAADFVGGVADLTDRGMTFRGNVGTHSFTAIAGSVTGTSSGVEIRPGKAHRFEFVLGGAQISGVPFSGVNTLTVLDASDNLVTDFDASSNNVTVTPSPADGVVSGLGHLGNDVINDADAFVDGVADLAGKLTFTGADGEHTFTASSGSAAAASNTVMIYAFAPDIDPDPTALDFGIVPLDEHPQLELQLTNLGTADLTITDATIDERVFLVASPAFPGAYVVEPLATFTVVVELRPLLFGDVTGTLEISSNDPDESTLPVALSAYIVAPHSTIGGLVYDELTGHGVSGVKLDLVADRNRNQVVDEGDDVVDVEYTLVTGYYDFTEVLPGNYLVAIDLTTVPDSLGLADGFAQARPVNIPELGGVDIDDIDFALAEGPPDIGLDQTIVDFGNVALDAWADRAINVSNRGVAMLEITRVSSDNADFALVDGDLPILVVPGGTAAVTIRFTPSMLGAIDGRLTIESNDPDEPAATVWLAGAGARAVDLAGPEAELSVDGLSNGDQLGVVAAGDVNGDGLADLIAAAPRADGRGRVDSGLVYVVYGQHSLPATLDLADADVTMYGAKPGDRCGQALCIGDVNGDDTDDIVIGSPFTDVGRESDAGMVYVVYGRDDIPDTLDFASGGADVILKGKARGDEAGSSVACGQVTEDDLADLLIGAPGASSGAGQAYVVYGHSSLYQVIDLANADVTILGAAATDGLGTSVAAGDLSGDGRGDLLLGATGVDAGKKGNEGAVYAIYGSPWPDNEVIDLSSSPADVTVLGSDTGGRLGCSLASGDFDGDGVDDAFIGARAAGGAARLGAGKAYLLRGGHDLDPVIDLGQTDADLTVLGSSSGDELGASVAIGDVNGDAFDDLLVGAMLADGSTEPATGAAYAIYGTSSPAPLIDLASHGADLTVFGANTADGAGASLASADLDGDEVPDLVIGSPGHSPSGLTLAGNVSVVLGALSGPSATPETIADIEAGDAVPRLFVGDFTIDFASGPGGALTVASFDKWPPAKGSGLSFVGRYWSVATKMSGLTATVTADYSGIDLTGLPEATLALFRYDRRVRAWEYVPSSADPALDTITTTVPVTDLSVWALGSRPAIAVAPASLDFGDVVRGGFRDLDLIITNRGAITLEIEGITGEHSAFSVVSPSFPQMVTAGDSITAQARFAPPVIGLITSELIVLSSDPASPALGVPVSGQGVVGQLDYFELTLEPEQVSGVPFTGTNHLRAMDVKGNVITDFDASASNVTLTSIPADGVITGLGSQGNHVLNRPGDFVGGVADLSALGMIFAGTMGVHTFVATSGAATGQSGPVDIQRGSLYQFAVTLSSPQTAGQPFVGSNELVAQDLGGNTITEFDAGELAVSITANPADGLVAGLGSTSTNVLDQATDFVNGRADLSALGMIFHGARGPHSFTARAGLAVGTSNVIEIQPGPLTSFLLIIPSPQRNAQVVSSGSTLAALDAYGSALTSFDASVTNVTITVSPLDGVVTGLGSGGGNVLNQASDFMNGVADLAALGMVYTGAAGLHTFTAIGGGRSGTTTVAIVPGDLFDLEVDLAAKQTCSAPFTGTNEITALDVSGNVIVDFDASAQAVTLSASPDDGEITGLSGGHRLTAAEDFVQGVADLTARGMTFTGTKGKHTFSATAGAVVGTSDDVKIRVGPLGAFAVSLSSSQRSRHPFEGANTIRATDWGGNTIRGFNASVTRVTLSSIPADGVISGLGSTGGNTLDRRTDFVKGEADLTALGMVFSGLAGEHRFVAQAGGVTGTSNPIDVRPSEFARFVVRMSPTQVDGVPFTGTNRLLAQDADGNPIENFDASVSPVIMTSSPADGQISGLGAAGANVLNQATDFADGVADLTALGMTFVGKTGPHTFTAISGGVRGTSSPVEILPGELTRFELVLEPEQRSGAPFQGTNLLSALDVGGNPITGFDATENPVTITVAPADGEISGLGVAGENVLDQAGDFVAGVADLTALGLTFTGEGGSHVFSATSGAVTGSSAEVRISTAPDEHPLVIRDFRVDQGTTGTARTPAIASCPNAAYVMVWKDGRRTAATAIYARIYRRQATPIVEDFRVDRGTHPAADPDVASDSKSRLCFVWKQETDKGEGKIFTRVFDSTGSPLIGPVQITQGHGLGHPKIAITRSDKRLVVWQSDDGIFVRKVTKKGRPRGRARQVDVQGATPAVGVNDKRVALAWEKGGEIYCAVLSGGGRLRTERVRVDQHDTAGASGPAVAMDRDGNFLVVWRYDSQIFARRFDAGIGPLSDVFRVDGRDAGAASQPAVTIDPLDNYVVTWTDRRDGDKDVFGRAYDHRLAPIRNVFRIDHGGFDAASHPTVTSEYFVPGGTGNLLTCWQDDREGSYHVYANVHSGVAGAD